MISSDYRIVLFILTTSKIRLRKGPKTNVPFANINAGFNTASSSLPITPPSPQCGFNPRTAILGLLILKTELMTFFVSIFL
jgi:hypothetical protein